MFDPRNSIIGEQTLANWLRKPITGDLEEVPGVGPKIKEVLKSGEFKCNQSYNFVSLYFVACLVNLHFFHNTFVVGVTNTYQLLGKYLMFKSGTMQEHQDAMFNWLRSVVRLFFCSCLSFYLLCL